MYFLHFVYFKHLSKNEQEALFSHQQHSESLCTVSAEWTDPILT